MRRLSRKNENSPPAKKLKTICDMGNHAREPRVTLSDDVIEHIISLLSIKEATQKSVLSKRFVNSWKHSEQLCFDSLFESKHTQAEATSIVDRVVTLHLSNKIESFHLCIDSVNIEPLIVSWLSIVSSKEPKLVNLDFSVAKTSVVPMEIPFEYLNIESIETLKLSYCHLHLPSKFQGLHFLRNMVLRKINLYSSFFKSICDNCSLLESIDIVHCHTVGHLDIDATALKYFKVLKIGNCYQLNIAYVNAPSLEVFHFVGKPHVVNFGGRMLRLRELLLSYKHISYVMPRHNMKELILKISHVRVLTINSTLLEDICSTCVHGANTGPRQYLWYLKELQLIMESTSFCNPYDIINFVDRCPLLERLFIDMQKFSFDASSQFWTQRDSAKFNKYEKEFSFLKLVKLSNFNFNILELQLAKFFLQKAPNLEYFALIARKQCRRKKCAPVSVDSLMSWRSSVGAKVGVYEHNDNENKVFVPHHQRVIWWY